MSRRLVDGFRLQLFFSILVVSFLFGIILTFISFIGISIGTSETLALSSFLNGIAATFISFYLAFFSASIYRQLIECFKVNPSLDSEFVKRYFIVRYPKEEYEENNDELEAGDAV